jgi:hypothetical protein
MILINRLIVIIVYFIAYLSALEKRVNAFLAVGVSSVRQEHSDFILRGRQLHSGQRPRSVLTLTARLSYCEARRACEAAEYNSD